MGFLSAGSLVGSGAVWAGRLIFAPGLFAASSGALLGLDLLVVSIAAAGGMVVSRGRWARNLGWLVVAAELGLAATMDLDAWGWASLAATLVTVILLAGPWLTGFLRQLPSADAPPVVAIALALGLLMAPGVMAAAVPAGLEPIHWIAAGLAAICAWSYSRAHLLGLWAARILVPALLLASAAFAAPAGRGLLIVGGLTVLGLAWSKPAWQAVRQLVPTVPGVAVPPELVPNEVLAAAGYDERGRRREEVK